MVFYEVADAVVRAQIYDSAIKGIAPRLYKFKQAVSEVSSGAWKNYFYRENSTVLTGQTGNAIKGIPRGAEFPQASAEWERVMATMEKYGCEDNIPWEDIISNEIDVRNRTLIKITEAVVKTVDDAIWDGLTENRTAVNIQEVKISPGFSWQTASAAIIDDLLNAQQKIAEYNYPTNDLMCFVSPKDKRSIMNYLAEKGAQFPQIATDVTLNGAIGRLAGMTIIESNSVTASYALVVVPKRCATWKELVALQSTTKTDEYKSETIRAVEMGVLQLTDPKACVLITNTQGTATA